MFFCMLSECLVVCIVMGTVGYPSYFQDEKRKKKEKRLFSFSKFHQPLMIKIQLLHVSTVARIALVKPDKARGVEDVLLRAAQMGQISEKVIQFASLRTADVHLKILGLVIYMTSTFN